MSRRGCCRGCCNLMPSGDLVPDRMWSHRAGDTIDVEIAMEAMPAEMVHLVEGNLSQVVGVRSVSRVARPCLRQVA